MKQLPILTNWLFWLLSASIFGFAPASTLGCGIGWKLPKSHFEGTDSHGHVMLTELFGRLNLGGGLSLPVFGMFDSSIGSSSPYLGQGWTLPLLESRVVQVDENTFRLDQPDGLFRLFWKDKNAPNVYNGQGGWKAEMRGSTITAVADCGTKLVFERGRLVSMQLKDRKLDYLYTGNQVSEIREAGVPLLRVETPQGSNEVTGLVLGKDQRIGLERVQRPRFQVVNGMALVAAMDHSLGRVVRADGSELRIEYPEPKGDKLIPSIKIGQRLVSWDPKTRKILKDGEWSYEVTPSEDPFANAAIKRTNSKNQSEFWHSDGAKGTEIVQGIDGVKHVITWFTSGKLGGAVRKREQVSKEGKAKVLYQASYNEDGKVFREVFADGSINEFKYNEHGEKVAKTRSVSGQEKYTAEYLKNGSISVVRSADGRTLQYFYDDQGREVRMFINGKLHSEKIYASDATWRKTIVHDNGSETPSRTFLKEFDASGRLIVERITEHSGDYPERIKKYSYDLLGRLIEKFDSQQGTLIYTYLPDGRSTSKLVKQ